MEYMRMSPCAIQQNSFATPEDAWTRPLTAARSVEKKGLVVCPKPRRLTLIQAMADPSRARPLTFFDVSSSCTDKSFLQDIASSSPPFFSGSPPSRVSNPLIQDARFGDEKFIPVPPRALPTPSGVSPPIVGAKFRSSPATRIVGFDCLDRSNRRNCGSTIPAPA